MSGSAGQVLDVKINGLEEMFGYLRLPCDVNKLRPLWATCQIKWFALNLKSPENLNPSEQITFFVTQ